MARVDQIDLIGERIPLRFMAGQAIVIPVSVLDPSDESGVNVTGRNYTAKIGPPGGASIAEFVVNAVDLAQGTFQLTMSNSVTALLTKGRYIWTFWEDNRLVLEGPVEIIANKLTS